MRLRLGRSSCSPADGVLDSVVHSGNHAKIWAAFQPRSPLAIENELSANQVRAIMVLRGDLIAVRYPFER
jgi:hypothetical protein